MRHKRCLDTVQAALLTVTVICLPNRCRARSVVAALVAWSGFSMRRTSLSATPRSRARRRWEIPAWRQASYRAAFKVIGSGGTIRGRRLFACEGSGKSFPSRIVAAISSLSRSRASASASSRVAPSYTDT